jgi:hypothetical protein
VPLVHRTYFYLSFVFGYVLYSSKHVCLYWYIRVPAPYALLHPKTRLKSKLINDLFQRALTFESYVFIRSLNNTEKKTVHSLKILLILKICFAVIIKTMVYRTCAVINFVSAANSLYSVHVFSRHDRKFSSGENFHYLVS